MHRLRRIGHFLLFTIMGMVIAACGNETPYESESREYDKQTQQPPVTRHSQLDSVMDGLTKIAFKDLPQDYLHAVGIEGTWATALRKKTWFRLERQDLFPFVVHQYRIGDFVPHDSIFKAQIEHPQPDDVQYWCMDRRVLHKLLDLLTAMPGMGLDPSQITINHGFRHPKLNVQVKGAKKSRHQWGEAIDLKIGDVNHDGVRDSADKGPLIRILDQKIIASGGGVGRYPGTDVIHLDVRGFRARWDSY